MADAIVDKVKSIFFESSRLSTNFDNVLKYFLFLVSPLSKKKDIEEKLRKTIFSKAFFYIAYMESTKYRKFFESTQKPLLINISFHIKSFKQQNLIVNTLLLFGSSFSCNKPQLLI